MAGIKFCSITILALLVGCQTYHDVRPGYELANQEKGSIHYNLAEMRAIYAIPRSEKGKVIVCAEPSPDIAKVFSNASSLGVSAQDGTSGIAAAFNMNTANAQAAAELGQRLATIQLLRDVLYRACEAYANGALSESSYTVMLSRIDDLIINLMMGEFVAGNHRRSSASLSSKSDLTADTSALTEVFKVKFAAQENAENAEQQTNTEEEALANQCAAASPEVKDKTTACDDAKAPQGAQAKDDSIDEDALNEQAARVATAKENEANAEQKAEEANAQAELVIQHTVQAKGATVSQSSPVNDNAEVLARIARKYMENVNFDSLATACLHELAKVNHRVKAVSSIDEFDGQPENKAASIHYDSSLAALCQEMNEKGGLLYNLLEGSAGMVQSKVESQSKTDQKTAELKAYAELIVAMNSAGISSDIAADLIAQIQSSLNSQAE